MKTPLMVIFVLFCASALSASAEEQAGDGSALTYSFESVVWSLHDDLGIQAGLLKGADEGLIGVCLRVWNNSTESPLVLRSSGRALSTFAAEIFTSDGSTFKARAALPKEIIGMKTDANSAEWSLLPRATKYFFVPARDFFPKTFTPPDSQKAKILVYITTERKDVHSTAHDFRSFPDTIITISKNAFGQDANAVFEDWSKQRGK